MSKNKNSAHSSKVAKVDCRTGVLCHRVD